MKAILVSICLLGIHAVGTSAETICPCARLNVTNEPYYANGGDEVDDTVGIQQALDDAASCAAACPGGAVVYLPPGEYLVSRVAGSGLASCLEISNETALEGDGAGISRIKLADQQPGSANVLSNSDDLGNSGIHLRGISFDANRDGNAGVLTTNGVRFTAVSDFSINKCEFSDGKGHGLILQTQTFRGIVEASIARNNLHSGFYVQSMGGSGAGTHSLRFVGCESSNNGDGLGEGCGFDAFDSESILYSGCLAQDNGKFGFHLDSSRSVSYSSCVAKTNGLGFSTFGSETDPTWQPSEDVSYSGCVAKGNSVGFSFLSSRGLSLTGCHSVENTGSGVEFLTYNLDRVTKNFMVSGGSIVENGGNGILVLGAQYGTINGVVIMNNGLNGPLPCNTSTCDGVYIRGGAYSGAGVVARNILVSGSQITDDPAVSSFQRYAVNAINLETERIHVFCTEVAGNHPQYGTPIRLAGPNSLKANNPGDE